MMPLPDIGAGSSMLAWRLDRQIYAGTWDSGIGAEKFGGRWNARGQRAVYCSIDPSTAILELAVHAGFPVLDTQPHMLTCAEIIGGPIHRVAPESVPNPAWLIPGTPSAGQQAFGSRLLAQHGIVLFPSAVSRFSWNLVMEPAVAKGRYRQNSQARLVLDTRLHPPLP
ncbi:RES domain-containing protein [Xylophilus rhododendri]|uniref:RES domain-containing protein n=1 Tax=Xylophilus rhododendri TaxID=2697032 RepID=A0A857J1T4_9BURK|nr:RES domain-containing protein [Xylophilus rhododendri]QHI97884.1 RES domain-containing protein [Xylophilus rhododendri]